MSEFRPLPPKSAAFLRAIRDTFGDRPFRLTWRGTPLSGKGWDAVLTGQGTFDIVGESTVRYSGRCWSALERRGLVVQDGDHWRLASKPG